MSDKFYVIELAKFETDVIKLYQEIGQKYHTFLN